MKLLILLLLTLFSSDLICFEKTEHDLGDVIEYRYTWRDMDDQRQTLAFKLEKELINNTYRRFKRYDQDEALNFVYQQLLSQVSQYNPRNVRVKFKRHHKKLIYSIKSKNDDTREKVLTELTEIEHSAQQAFLEKHHYVLFQSPWHGPSIKVDHLRFAQEGLAHVAPIAAAIEAQMTLRKPRDVINFVLNWVQSIPYSPLEDRKSSNGAGFNPPLRLLTQNIGDCDSKMILAATILKNIYPRLSIVLLYLPEHALLGFQLPIVSTDNYVDIEGLNYLLAEPVGPALLPLSEVSQSSRSFVDGKSYYHEIF
ncbi:hypothetical protein PULV_a2151 [Pseudoalteromonas ulvae UL12]|uniref:Transglutaminase-like domain-containing protein n=1 Tax=Pseudoalteromonas ulvae TaxID=107327 RepID=A0A244CQH4_PSEDV|nr:hypothetical protein [Pseudoalteromonas ulvae]MBE0365369.1 hypothetical protein [Pseudoalteromonas ulvae UL12]OUL57845.1 hypothetical protein B1199_12380 [Pseudoalteromonas ulvae]